MYPMARANTIQPTPKLIFTRELAIIGYNDVFRINPWHESDNKLEDENCRNAQSVSG